MKRIFSLRETRRRTLRVFSSTLRVINKVMRCWIGFGASFTLLILPDYLEAVSPKPGLFDKHGYCAKTAAWIPSSQAGADEPEPLLSPAVGNRNIIVLLVEFADNRADKVSHSSAAYQKLLFDSTGVVATGSMSEYYQEVSYGRLCINGDVSVWLEAPQANTYYTDDQFGKGSWPRNRRKLAYDVVVTADPFIDFSQYDGDGNGEVDALFIVHAGPGGEDTGETNDLWSHKWTLPANANGTGEGYVTDDGVEIVAYTMQPEEHADGRLISIGVFCHEYGHVLGLPDLYDRDNSSQGIGNWGIMGSGSWGGDGRSPETPVHFCAWSKEKLGWIQPTIIDNNTVAQCISRVEEHPEVYKLWTRGMPSNEYFLIENRQKAGFDSKLPNDGLFIWHIDNSVTTQNDNEDHKLVDLEAADGNEDLDRGSNRGDAGDPFPGSTGSRFFDFFSRPNSRMHTGGPSQVSVRNISDSQPTMTADFEVAAEHPILLLDDFIVIDSQGDADGKADPGETVDFVIALRNYGREATHVTGKLITTDQTIDVSVATVSFENIPFASTGHNQHAPFVFSVAPSADVHYAHFTLIVRSEDNTDSTALDLRLVIGHPSILLVDDDYDPGTSEWVFDVEEFYRSALDSIENIHDYWNWGEGGTPEASLLKTYDIVIWFTGHAEPPLNPADIDNLTSFLDGGGGLFLTGQDLGFKLQHSSFLTNYLHAQFVADDSEEGFLTGVPEDPLSGGILGFVVLSGADAASNQPSPDVIAPLHEATPVFTYTPSGRTAALKYEGHYRLVYFAFGFEALSTLGLESRTLRENLLEKILDWLKGKSTDVDPLDFESTAPQEYALTQNYPNPFNSKTEIRFQIIDDSEPTYTTLKVFNALGQEIRTLVDEAIQSGYYSVTWDGRDENRHEAASGVYFYQLSSKDFIQTKRMIFVR